MTFFHHSYRRCQYHDFAGSVAASDEQDTQPNEKEDPLPASKSGVPGAERDTPPIEDPGKFLAAQMAEAETKAMVQHALMIHDVFLMHDLNFGLLSCTSQKHPVVEKMAGHRWKACGLWGGGH